MIYKYWEEFDMNEWEWINFTPKELSCKCCGQYYHDPASLDALQEARNIAGKAFIINSAQEELMRALFEGGFTTFGMYNTFVHTDIRPWRRWYACDGVIKNEWQDIYKRVVKGD